MSVISNIYLHSVTVNLICKKLNLYLEYNILKTNEKNKKTYTRLTAILYRYNVLYCSWLKQSKNNL